ALAREKELGGTLGIDAALAANNLDALVAPTGSAAWPNDLVNGDHFRGASSFPSAMAGYPIVEVPAGVAFGLPIGISFIGTACGEPTRIKLAAAFEAATGPRAVPKFIPTMPLPPGQSAFKARAMRNFEARKSDIPRRIDALPRAARARLTAML